MRAGNQRYCNEMIYGADMGMTGVGGIGGERAPGWDYICMKSMEARCDIQPPCEKLGMVARSRTPAAFRPARDRETVVCIEFDFQIYSLNVNASRRPPVIQDSYVCQGPAKGPRPTSRNSFLPASYLR